MCYCKIYESKNEQNEREKKRSNTKNYRIQGKTPVATDTVNV